MKGVFFAVGVLFMVSMVTVAVGANKLPKPEIYQAEIACALWAIAAMLAFKNSKGRES